MSIAASKLIVTRTNSSSQGSLSRYEFNTELVIAQCDEEKHKHGEKVDADDLVRRADCPGGVSGGGAHDGECWKGRVQIGSDGCTACLSIRREAMQKKESYSENTDTSPQQPTVLRTLRNSASSI